MGSRLPPTTNTENCDQDNQNSDDKSSTIELGITQKTMESGDNRHEKQHSSQSGSQMDQQEIVSASLSDQLPSTEKLIPPEQRVNGSPFGTVLGHKYTDNKHTDLDNWLPDALNQTAAKRKVLMDLEQRVVKYIAEELNQPFLLLKSSDTYQRLAIYRVTAYFGLDCRSKNGDLIASRTPYTRIPEDNIRFEAMLRELREDKEGADQKPVDQGGDMRSMPAYSHSRETSAAVYQRSVYAAVQPQLMRFRTNPNVPNRFGPAQTQFHFNMAQTHSMPARMPPPARRFPGGNARFRNNAPHGGHFVNNHHQRWVNPNEGMPMAMTFDGVGSTGANRSRSVPNVITGVADPEHAHRSSSGVKSYEYQANAASGDPREQLTNSEAKPVPDVAGNAVKYVNTDSNSTNNVSSSVASVTSASTSVTCNSTTSTPPNQIEMNKDANPGTQSNEDSEVNRCTINHQIAAMTIDVGSKGQIAVTESVDRRTVSSGTTATTASSISGQIQYQQDATVSNAPNNIDQLNVPPPQQVAMSPLRMGTPHYPPPQTGPRPSTLNVYGSHAYTAQPVTPGQPTMLMMADSQGFIQASPQVGHAYSVPAAVAAAAPSSGTSLDQSSAMPVLPQAQSFLYVTPQLSHQTPSVIYLNPVQPNPVISSGGQSSEYAIAQYRDLATPTAGPPPSVPYSSYSSYSSYPQMQQVATSMPPPAPSGLTYYAAPSEVIYSGANVSQPSQPLNSQEYVHYSSGTALPFTGYTLSPYLAQQGQSPTATGFVNYIPTAAAYASTYATSAPLVFQPAPGYNMPPPPTDVARLPSEVHRPVQWVPVPAGKGTGFMPTVHIAPSTPTRPLNVADVQLVGQPITVHSLVPVAQLPASQRMDGTPIVASASPSIYRQPPPIQANYHKSASFGIRPSGSSFRSTGPTISVPTRPSNVQYQ